MPGKKIVREPRWPAFVAMIAASGVYWALPEPLSVGPPQALLRAAVALWFANVLVFALWYWKLDAGGPLGRESATGKIESAFLFPQMLTNNEPGAQEAKKDSVKDPVQVDPRWTPHFMDYLFLAFNTSTAFSPTDTAVLSRWAKVSMMLQAIISLAIIAIIAARAINIL